MKARYIQNLFSKSLVFRALLIWLGLCILAFVNGALREIVLKPILNVPEPTANQISCLTGVLFLTVFTVWYWKPLNIKSMGQALLVGLGWFFATLLFETLVIDRNLSWTQIVDTYDVFNGQFWGLVLIWIGLMPLMLYFLLNFRRYPVVFL
ncbi:MAG: hypothetical protein ACOYOK_07125 [Pseudobdellovibrionaceae bacterium]